MNCDLFSAELRKGAPHWNTWINEWIRNQWALNTGSSSRWVPRDFEMRCRRAIPLSGADLKKCDLEDADLQGMNLTRANLCEAKLTNAQLSYVLLESADLRRAHVQNARLVGARLGKANLREANLTGADCERAVLGGADMAGVILDGTSFRGADLMGVNLSMMDLTTLNLFGVNLRGANLRRSNLAGCDLYGVNLAGANLFAANLEDVDLQEAYLGDSILAKALLKRARLKETNFERANLEGADLEQVDLELAHLTGAILRNANLKNSNLRRAELENAVLEGANLENAIMEESNLTGAQLRSARLSNVDVENVKGIAFDRNDITGVRFAVHPERRWETARVFDWTTLWRWVSAQGGFRLSPYDDMWSKLRRDYTGAKMVLIWLAFIAFLAPRVVTGLWLYALSSSNRLVDSLIRSEPNILPSSLSAWDAWIMSRDQERVLWVFLGLTNVSYESIAWAVLSVLLFAYTISRFLLTLQVIPLREAEARSNRTPAKEDYLGLYRLHRWIAPILLVSWVLAITNLYFAARWMWTANIWLF